MDGPHLSRILIQTLEACGDASVIFPAEKDVDILSGAGCAIDAEPFSQQGVEIIGVDGGKIQRLLGVAHILAAGELYRRAAHDPLCPVGDGNIAVVLPRRGYRQFIGSIHCDGVRRSQFISHGLCHIRSVLTGRNIYVFVNAAHARPPICKFNPPVVKAKAFSRQAADAAAQVKYS